MNAQSLIQLSPPRCYPAGVSLRRITLGIAGLCRNFARKGLPLGPSPRPAPATEHALPGGDSRAKKTGPGGAVTPPAPDHPSTTEVPQWLL